MIFEMNSFDCSIFLAYFFFAFIIIKLKSGLKCSWFVSAHSLKRQTCNQRVDTFASNLQLRKLMQHECVACSTCQLHHRENKVSDSVVFPLRSAAAGLRWCSVLPARRRGAEENVWEIKIMRGVNNRGGTPGSTPADVMRADENADSKTAATRDGGLKMGLMERMFAPCWTWEWRAFCSVLSFSRRLTFSTVV